MAGLTKQSDAADKAELSKIIQGGCCSALAEKMKRKVFS
jgi:hypothetical protein